MPQEFNYAARHMRVKTYSGIIHRQHKRYRTPCFAAFQHIYGSSVLFGNGVNQRQPQSGTSHGPAAGLVYTEKRIKDFFLIFR